MSIDLSPIKDQLAVIQQGIRQHFNAMSDETGAWNEICTYLTKLEMGIVPLTVIAPPLEWGEWRDSPDGINRWKRSKCGRYDIHQDMFENEFGSYLDRNDMSLDITCTEQEAEQVCQIHLQYKITQAIEGCNVIPYKDPQGLVDALRQISEVLKRFCQTGKLGELQQSVIDAELILKAWEDGK